MDLLTQYTYEKKWQKTSPKDALRMINEEMPETDEEDTLAYIMKEVKKGKVITLGSCRFKSTQ
jgi:ribosomal protein S25